MKRKGELIKIKTRILTLELKFPEIDAKQVETWDKCTCTIPESSFSSYKLNPDVRNFKVGELACISKSGQAFHRVSLEHKRSYFEIEIEKHKLYDIFMILSKQYLDLIIYVHDNEIWLGLLI